MENIIFFGSSDFSAGILSAMLLKFNIAAVVTQPDKPVGRKHQVSETPVAELAKANGIKIFKPESLKNPDFIKSIQEINPEIFVVVAYGKIIPGVILNIAKQGALNIHGSVLPEYRGASPIHSALRDGRKTTGITVMLMDKEMDHGPILMQKSIPISPDDTFKVLEQKLLSLAEEMILESIPLYLNGDIEPKPQDDSSATYCGLLSKQDGLADWSGSRAAEIYNQFRAYLVWPGLWSKYKGKILKITKCQVSDIEPGPGKAPGSVFLVGEEVFVACKGGSLQIEAVQLEGKQPVAAKDFINGHKDFAESVLGN